MKHRRRERLTDIGLLVLVIVLACLMAGCTGTGGALQVRVPVPIVCQEKVPDRPIMPTEGMKPGGKLFDGVIAMQSEIGRREAYELKLRAALVACTSPLQGASGVK